MKDLFLLQPDMVFLNHGSFGACPAPVFAVYQEWQRALEAQPVEFLGRRFATLMAAAREALRGDRGHIRGTGSIVDRRLSRIAASRSK